MLKKVIMLLLIICLLSALSVSAVPHMEEDTIENLNVKETIWENVDDNVYHTMGYVTANVDNDLSDLDFSSIKSLDIGENVPLVFCESISEEDWYRFKKAIENQIIGHNKVSCFKMENGELILVSLE